MLEKFLESNHKFFAHDYEVIKIDQENMLNGVALEDRLRRGRQTGLPWIVILDSDGNELSTGIGPKGNIGCPVEPHGIEHFMGMLEKTAIRTAHHT